MREADIRPREVHAEYIRLSREDADRFFGDRSGLRPRPCPGCGRDVPRPAFRKHGFDLVRCGSCDSLYVNPCPTSDQLEPLYAGSASARYWANVFFPTVAELRRTRVFRPRVERVLSLMSEAAGPLVNVIEVGAGAAIFLEELRKVRPDLILRAVEPSPDLAATCRTKGFATCEATAERASLSCGWGGTADLVVCFEVIEHTSDTPGFLSALADLAKPGGNVLVSGLSGDGFDIRVLGPRSMAVAPPHHLTFLSLSGAEELFARCGLEDVRIFTPGVLDVDIVVNALKDDDAAVTDPFLRKLLLERDDAPRVAFQKFLSENGLSSHMWVIGRRSDRGCRKSI